MIYPLFTVISNDSKALWAEGAPYEKHSIYKIEEGKLPPVNYDSHTLKPHSITHLESSGHTVAGGKTLDYYYSGKLFDFFHGECLIVKIHGNGFEPLQDGQNYIWEVSADEIESAVITAAAGGNIPHKILIAPEYYPVNEFGYHREEYVFKLSRQAALYLDSIEGFNLFGTTWKSLDYNPGRREREIHEIIFRKALVMELLHLQEVPAGRYYLTAFPLFLEGATESPVSPVVYPLNFNFQSNL